MQFIFHFSTMLKKSETINLEALKQKLDKNTKKTKK